MIHFSWKRLIIGLLISVGGFIVFASERKRARADRRDWLMWIGVVIMVIGTAYGLGVGEFLLANSLISLLNNNK